ncbi:MAG: response regulator [Actinobacteria bacterium]|nr:response regulator [Actinomycetota bacterium]MBE3115426.1 response regulator [Actinomycetota bacterium]
MERAVLIVDDDHIVCKELEKELRRNYFSTYIAYTGTDALEILNKKKFDVILLDVKIPDINGLKLLKQVKEKWTNCEVIIMTGYGSQEVAIQALHNGAIDYLEKPIKLDELNTALGRALEKLAEKEELIYRSSVLVVDDDKEFTQKIKNFLNKEGYNIFTAHDGIKGLEIINGNKIDVVLTDIKMSGMDGIKLLEKSKELHKDIEVIMMTGYGDEELAVKALRRGAINYLRKPIDLNELCIAIEKAIEKIVLYRNQLYRNRELKISKEIISKMNEELERKIRERTLKLSQTQTQLFQTSKLATLGEMSTGLAHELNQPLTGISLIAANIRKLIKMKLLKEKELEEAVKDIEENVRRMSNVISHIRTFARQDTLKFAHMDINDSIKGALNLLGEQLRLQDIKVIKELSNNLPMIEGERYQIEQVVINIISNARDALDDKGRWDKKRLKDWSKTITIKTAMQKNYKKEDCVCIHVSDNGTGMSPEVKQKMFEPFFTTKEVGKATGLGMSISYGIVQSHKGMIYVDSKEGEGNAVSVELPIKIKE